MEGYRRIWLALVAFCAAVVCAVPTAAAERISPCVVRLDGPVTAEVHDRSKTSCIDARGQAHAGDFLAIMTFAPVVSSAEDPLLLRQTSLWQDSERVHFHYADGETAQVDWNSRNASQYMAIGARFEIPAPPRSSPIVGIDVEIRGATTLRGVIVGTEILRRSESLRQQIGLAALYAGFVGLALALLVYNIAYWVALRHQFQLAYSIMVAALAGYAFTTSGALLLVFDWIDNNDRIRANYVLLGIAAVSAVTFIRQFLGPGVVGPKLRMWFNLGCAFCLVATLAFAAFSPVGIFVFDRLYFLSGLMLMGAVAALLWNAWRVRNRYLWLFLFAWSAPLVLTGLRLLHGFDLVPHSFWLDNSNLIGLGVEALVSTAMISLRLRELGDERDQAQASAQTAIRLANTDPLTGLLNRRAFMEMAVGRPSMHRLMLIDLDRFKGVNDRLGHDVGDEVLRRIARALQGVRPAESLVARLGGEEFAILLPLTQVENCSPEQVLAAIRAHPMPFELQLTASLGFAEGRVINEMGWKRVYRLADAALYRAKADGRDRVCRATDFADTSAAA